MDISISSKRSKIKKPDSIANSEKNYHEPQPQENDYHSEPVFPSSRTTKPKAIISLNIGDYIEQIKIFDGQDLYEIAIEIATKYDLNEEFIEYLVLNIESQLKDHEKKQQKSFLSTIDSISSQQTKSQKELHYENWQRILKEKLNNNPNTSNNFQNKTSETPSKNSKFSPIKQRSVSPIRNMNDCSNITEKLFNESKILKKKQINSEKLKEENELKQCSFKPKINEKSLKIINRDKSEKPIHEKLYEESSFIIEKRDKFQKEQFSKNYPFQPETSQKNNRDIMSNNNNKANMMKKQKELTTRLVNSKKESEKSFINMKKKGLEEDNNKNNFTPAITKDRYYYKAKEKEDSELENYRNVSPKPISKPAKPSEKPRKIPKKTQEIPIKRPELPLKTEPSPIKLPEKPRTLNIFDEYLSILKGIFNEMDDDRDGIINCENIDLSNVDPGFLEIIQGILLKMDEDNSFLDFQGFLNAIEDNHLEVRIHSWMSKNYESFEKLDKFYENMTPKHIQQFSFGGLEPGFEFIEKPLENVSNNKNALKMGELSSRYKNLIKN